MLPERQRDLVYRVAYKAVQKLCTDEVGVFPIVWKRLASSGLLNAPANELLSSERLQRLGGWASQIYMRLI